MLLNPVNFKEQSSRMPASSHQIPLVAVRVNDCNLLVAEKGNGPGLPGLFDRPKSRQRNIFEQMCAG